MTYQTSTRTRNVFGIFNTFNNTSIYYLIDHDITINLQRYLNVFFLRKQKKQPKLGLITANKTMLTFSDKPKYFYKQKILIQELDGIWSLVIVLISAFLNAK